MNLFKLFTQKSKDDSQHLETLAIKLDGMHCASCSLLIDDTVEEIDGVESSKTSYRKGESSITFDPQKTTIQEVSQAIIELGYKIKS